MNNPSQSESQFHCFKSITPAPVSTGVPFTCLNSNNTAENSGSSVSLSPYKQKQVHIITENVKKFIKEFGVNNVGFLTLTFRDNVTDHKEAYRRFCSFRKHFLSHHFGEWLLFKERQKRGAWHYHILVDCGFDIRTGVDFDKVQPPDGSRPDYRSCSPELRHIWKLLRESLPKYGFGSGHLLPIRKNTEAVAFYVSGYVLKSLKGSECSGFNDKGVRLFSASRGLVRSSTKFAWNTSGGKEWRRKLALFTESVLGFSSTDQIKAKYGPKWAYHLSDVIFNADDFLSDDSSSVVFSDGFLVDSETGTELF